MEGKGSATAPPALTAGTAQLGPMSRKMKPEEEDAFEKQHGFKPTRISVALDCLAVYVHKDNPIKGLTLAQVDCIFSKTHKSGFQDIATWGQAGLEAPWDTMPMSLYGRNSASGTYAYFKEHALLKGDYKDTVKEQPGSAAVVNGVAADRAGIGYSGIGYRTSEVRAIPLAKDGKAPLDRAHLRQCHERQLSAGPHAVRLRGPETRRAVAQARGGVSQVRAFSRRPGDCRQGRLWSAAREDSRETACLVEIAFPSPLGEGYRAAKKRSLVTFQPSPPPSPKGRGVSMPRQTLPSRRAQRRDKLARWLITLGGVTVIASVVAILALIVGVTVPLFRALRAEVVCTSHLPNTLPGEDVLALGIDMGMSEADVTAFIWTTGGAVAFVDVRTGKLLGQERPTPPAGGGKRSLGQVDSLGGGRYSLLWSDGAMSLVEIAARGPRICWDGSCTPVLPARTVRQLPPQLQAHVVSLYNSDLGQHSRRQGPGAANGLAPPFRCGNDHPRCAARRRKTLHPAPDRHGEPAGRGGNQHVSHGLAAGFRCRDPRDDDGPRRQHPLRRHQGRPPGPLATWRKGRGDESRHGAGVSRPSRHHGPGHGAGRRLAGRRRCQGRANDLVSRQRRLHPQTPTHSSAQPAPGRSPAHPAFQPQQDAGEPGR